MNLLDETLLCIADSGHSTEDIRFIGSDDGKYVCTWGEFQKLANVDYDNGFGTQHVAQDLIIGFSDGQQMWRHEYDGSEYWNYSRPLPVAKNPKSITSLFAKSGWETMEEINGE